MVTEDKRSIQETYGLLGGQGEIKFIIIMIRYMYLWCLWLDALELSQN